MNANTWIAAELLFSFSTRLIATGVLVFDQICICDGNEGGEECTRTGDKLHALMYYEW
jgi:hypothetical protein